MRRSILLLPSCLAFAALAGCGQKGPLVMPPTRPAVTKAAPTPVVPASSSSAASVAGKH